MQFPCCAHSGCDSSSYECKIAGKKSSEDGQAWNVNKSWLTMRSLEAGKGAARILSLSASMLHFRVPWKRVNKCLGFIYASEWFGITEVTNIFFHVRCKADKESDVNPPLRLVVSAGTETESAPAAFICRHKVLYREWQYLFPFRHFFWISSVQKAFVFLLGRIGAG